MVHCLLMSCCHNTILCVGNDGEQTAKNNKIKPRETQGFNVENPSNAEGKNHGRQPSNLHYIGCVYNA